MNFRWAIPVLALAAVLAASGAVSAEEPDPAKSDDPSRSAPASRPAPEPAEDNEIHSCRDQNGNIVLQTDPCPTRKKPTAPGAVGSRAEAPGTKKGKRTRPAPKPPRLPARRSPAAPAESYRKSTGPDGREWFLVPRGRSPNPTSGWALGNQTFPIRLGSEHHPASPSFATPERTWRTFLAAIERGDRPGAVDCFTPAARDRYGSDSASFPLDDLRAMLAGLDRIENGGDLGPLWSIRGVRARRQPKWIFFEESPAGEWKLTGF